MVNANCYSYVLPEIVARLGSDDPFAGAKQQATRHSYAEAILVVKQVLGESPMPVAYDRVPWAIYCHPEVAWAGPGEDACKQAGVDVIVGKHPFKFNSRAQILGETDGMVKIIAKKNADGSAGQVLGVHMVGPWVTEQLSGGYRLHQMVFIRSLIGISFSLVLVKFEGGWSILRKLPRRWRFWQAGWPRALPASICRLIWAG